MRQKAGNREIPARTRHLQPAGGGRPHPIFRIPLPLEKIWKDLSALVDMSSPAVSHHLKQLKAGGLIVSRREGKEVYYKAADTEQVELLHHAIEDLVKIACPSK